MGKITKFKPRPETVYTRTRPFSNNILVQGEESNSSDDSEVEFIFNEEDQEEEVLGGEDTHLYNQTVLFVHLAQVTDDVSETIDDVSSDDKKEDSEGEVDIDEEGEEDAIVGEHTGVTDMFAVRSTLGIHMAHS
jgi:hypothetical protein